MKSSSFLRCFGTCLFSVICPLFCYEVSQENFGEGVVQQVLQKDFLFFSTEVDLNKSNLASDVIPVMGTQFIEVSTTPRGTSGQSNQIGAVSVGLNGNVNESVALFGSCHVLFEPYRCDICLGAPSFIFGGSYNFHIENPKHYLFCFCEGVWGYYSENHREGYIQPLGVNLGFSGGKECYKGIGIGLSCGMYRRTSRHSELRPYFVPGHVLYCSPEVSCHLGEYATFGSKCGVYLKQQDYLGEVVQLICPSALATRWELFYQVDLGEDLTVKLSYIRSSCSKKFGNASLGLNLRL